MCAWAGGAFTRANGTNEWVTDYNNGVGIEPGRHDAQDNDLATGINQCLNKDGSNLMTGNLNLNNNIPTNIGAGTAAAPAICAGGDVNTGIFSPSADNWAVATNGTERVRIDNTGKVGIGITAPTTNLSVVSAASADCGISLRGNNTTAANEFLVQQASDGATTYVYNRANGPLIFGTNNLERMRMSSAGDVSVGTTGALDRFNVTKDVNGYTGIAVTNQDQVVRLQAYYVGGVGQWGSIQSTTGAGVAQNLSLQPVGGNVGIGVTAPTFRLQLNADSAAKPTTNTWTIVSDQRIKTNVEPYTKGLAEVCQVKPITYDYNGKGGLAAGPGGVSILAQELQPIFPECIGSYKAKLNDDDAEETDILNYNGHAITFALINAVKELNVKVVALEARVAALES